MMKKSHRAGRPSSSILMGTESGTVEPDQPVDPTKDKRINAAFCGVTVSPLDGSVWRTVLGFPAQLLGEFRSAEVQGPTPWAHRDRAALPRGMDAVCSRCPLFNKT